MTYLSNFGLMFIGGYLTNIAYKTLTKGETTISIHSKINNFNTIYSFGNISKYALYDKNKNLFTIPYYYINKPVYPAKLWSELICGNTYNITYYGFNIPKLGIYPRIIKINNYEIKYYDINHKYIDNTLFISNYNIK
jgi:hypothetical protein